MRINYVLDCADPDKLADFWAAVLGCERSDSGEPYVALRRPGTGQPELLLQRVPEPKAGKNRMHPDLRVDDGEAEVARLVGLGAAVLRGPFDDEGHRTRVMADPEGSEFCVIVSPKGWWPAAGRQPGQPGGLSLSGARDAGSIQCSWVQP